MIFSIKKLANHTKHKDFTVLSESSQLLDAVRRKLGVIGVLAALCTLPGVAFAQPSSSITEKREMDKKMFEECLGSDMGSSDEAEKCTAWFVQSACDGAYIDNRGEVDSFVSRENFVNYLREADKRLRKQKKCDPMGVRRLILSEIARDKDADNATQIDRWKFILSGMPSLIPEQQQFICQTVVEDSRFETLMADKATRAQLAKCLSSLDAVNVSQSERATIVSRFDATAPELLTDDARAVLIMDDLNAQRYETARARLENIDLPKLSKGVKSTLLERVAPLGNVIFRESLLDSGILWQPGFEPVAKPADDRKLALWKALMDVNSANAAWFAELEAGILLARGDAKNVAIRATILFGKAPKEAANVKYVSKLIIIGSEHQQYLLLKSLATNFLTMDGNAREQAAKQFGRPLAEALLKLSEAEIQSVAAKGKITKTDIPEQSVTALEALLKFNDPAYRSKVCVMLGRMSAHRGNDAQALKYWYEAIKDEKDADAAQEAWYLIVTSLRKQNKTNDANVQLSAFEAKYPASKWLLML